MNEALDALIRALDDMRWVHGLLEWDSLESMELEEAIQRTEESAADLAWKLWKSVESFR